MAPQRSGEGRPLPPAAPVEEGLPRAFLQSLRTLFDILDDRRRGYVHLREIESRWLQHGPPEAKGELPWGVLEGLRRAAPASGYLTFERFVLGLRSSLLSPEKGSPRGAATAPHPAAAPLSKSRGEIRGPDPERVAGRGGAGAASRSLEKISVEGTQDPIQSKRAATDSCGIRKAAGWSQNEGATKAAAMEARRQPRSRGEHRRHTITNGVDYSVLKQMKEVEKAKDVLLQGLELVDRAREWYHQQFHLLQEHQKQLGRSKTPGDLLADGSHLSHLLPKLQDLNRCLSELLSLSAKPLSPCPPATKGPTPATTTSPPLSGPQQTINMLKEQNWLLTKEVTEKSDRITQLEQEKSTLIKQLFEARAQSNREASQLDSTFI
ncbi:suppressor APC domain-containing protein 2 [Pogona vitticeps]